MSRRSFADRFHAMVRKTDTCWLWATPGWQGYGGITYQGRRIRATHAALLVYRGALPPKGSEVCHRCDNPSCVNPDHLFVGTHADNMRDMVAKGRHRLPPPLTAEQRARGSRHGMARLTEEAVREIRHSVEPTRVMARRFAVHPATIRKARRGAGWAHVATRGEQS